MSMNALRKTVKRAENTRDTFPVGTAIRWVSEAPGNPEVGIEDGIRRYSYAAFKTPVGWYTTSRDYNRFVPPVVDWKALLEILARDETTDVEVSETWTRVSAAKG